MGKNSRILKGSKTNKTSSSSNRNLKGEFKSKSGVNAKNKMKSKLGMKNKKDIKLKTGTNTRKGNTILAGKKSTKTKKTTGKFEHTKNNEENEGSDDFTETSNIADGASCDDESDETTLHKKQLESLKDLDPEFYNFLKTEDGKLLEFQCEDDDLLNGEYEFESSEENVEENVDDLNVKGNEAVEITDKHVYELMENEEKYKYNMKEFFSYYHYIVCDEFEKSDIDESDNILKNMGSKIMKRKTIYQFESVATRNKIMNFCLKKLPIHIKSLNEKNELPNSINPFLKTFFLDNLMLLNRFEQSSDAIISILTCMNYCEKLLKLYPKILHACIKIFVGFLQHKEEDIRIGVFTILKKFGSNKSILESIINRINKQYFSGTQFNKYRDVESGIWLFLKVSISELIIRSPLTAYRMMFNMIKSKIVLLKNAITLKTKESIEKIHTWQFLHSIELVCFALGLDHSEPLNSLIDPVYQIIMAAIRLTSSSRYLPFVLHLLSCVVKLASDCGIYVPIGYTFMKLLEMKEFSVPGVSVAGQYVKEPILNQMIKTGKEQANLSDYKIKCFNQIIRLLLKHLVCYSDSAAFPDFAYLFVKWLKKFVKNTKNRRHQKLVKTLVNKIEEHSKTVQELRSSNENKIKQLFEPGDINSTIKSNIVADNKNVLIEFFKNSSEEAWSYT